MSGDLNDVQRRVREILVPGGEPLGEPGRSRTGTIRILPEGLAAAQHLFELLAPLGEAEERSGYRGPFISLESVNPTKPSGVGLRRQSRSGEPTLDVTIDYVPEITKIKFPPEIS